MNRAVSFLLASLVATIAHAQAATITTVPANPVAGVPFIVRVVISPCFDFSNAVVSNGNIDIHLTDIAQFDPCQMQRDVNVGPLPAGNYTVRLFAPNASSPFATAPVVVSADIPALDPYVLAMLAATFIVVAALRLRVR